MTYTYNDAITETQAMLEQALHSTNAEYVMSVARTLAGIPGWEEEAQILQQQAQDLTNKDWAYDRAVDNMS